jgi:hypothetical protein
VNKLSKEKRDKLILTSLGIIGVLGLLYTFVLGAQKDALNTLENQISGTSVKLAKAEALVRSADAIETRLAQSKALLESRQEHMAPQGQYYYWFLQLLDQFRKKENFETNFILDLTQPEFIDAGLLPKFPYKAASFGVRLNGRYQEVGRFIADLENTFPYFRVQNVRLVPQGTSPGALTPQMAESEDKLTVEIRIVTPIKPGAT